MTPAIEPSQGSRRPTRLGLMLKSLFALGLVVSAHSNPALAQEPPEAAPALVPPTLVESVEPAYPESKRASGEAASVILSLELDMEGHVTKASVLESGGAEFDESALAAAKGLVFTPATKDGVKVASRIAFLFDGEAWSADDVPEVEACETTGNEYDDCPKATRHRIEVVVPKAAVERGQDEFGRSYAENVAVQFYATEGIFKDESRIYGETTTGWAARQAASGETVTFYLVVRDDRGGVSWEERRVAVR